MRKINRGYGRPRKRDQGTLEKVRGMLFEAMTRHAKIAETHADDLDVQKMTGHALSQLAGQWIKTYEKSELIAALKRSSSDTNITRSFAGWHEHREQVEAPGEAGCRRPEKT